MFVKLFKKGSATLDHEERARLAEEKIEDVIEAAEAEGLLDAESGEMIKGVIDFSSSMARQVMVPRTEIVAVELSEETEVETVIRAILSSGHSRIPAYKETIDNIKGLIYAKDLLKHWGCDRIDMDKVLRKPYFIPETKKLEDLLNEFQAKRIQMAIVIDEYGGTSGLVTTEDLIEEIVGEISDEYDDDPTLLHVVKSGELVVSSRLEIDELFEHMGIDEPDGKFSTVGGWIFAHTGYIPQQGETFNIDGVDVTIEIADERTIKRVKVVWKQRREES